MLAGHAAIALYVDEIKRRQAKRIEEERREASTTIARRITHEVNNPLSIIKNYIRVLRQKLPEEDGVQDELRIVGEELDRVADLVRQLSAFSGPQVGLREPIDLNGLINDLIKIIKKSILPSSTYETHLSLDPKLPNVVTDKNSLVQIMLNLIKNAAEAMPEGGNIHIETKYVDAFGRRLIGEDNGDSGGVRITVRDDGPGIPPAIQARLFEPSNTTKGESHYGLGLSIVRSLLKELGGGIECTSEEGKGTSFEITLPIGT
jgi:signal transduction histidine kinase